MTLDEKRLSEIWFNASSMRDFTLYLSYYLREIVEGERAPFKNSQDPYVVGFNDALDKIIERLKP